MSISRVSLGQCRPGSTWADFEWSRPELMSSGVSPVRFQFGSTQVDVDEVDPSQKQPVYAWVKLDQGQLELKATNVNPG